MTSRLYTESMIALLSKRDTKVNTKFGVNLRGNHQSMFLVVVWNFTLSIILILNFTLGHGVI